MKPYKYIFAILALALLAACSTTTSVPEDDQLFIGLKTTKYVDYEPSDHFNATREEVEAALATEPNGAFFGSSSIRLLPYRLWIYNAFYDSDTRFSKWVRKTFGKAPVLMSGVNPRLRAQVATELLRSHGYFSGYVGYDVLTQNNPKKAKVAYTVNLGELHTIDTLDYVNFPKTAQALIDSTRTEALVRNGSPFNVSTLDAERTRVSTLLRNNGYFYYQPDYAT